MLFDFFQTIEFRNTLEYDGDKLIVMPKKLQRLERFSFIVVVRFS